MTTFARQYKFRRMQRGMTLIEVLVAALVVSVSLAATVSLWRFAYGITGQTDDRGIGYSIGRRAMEEIRETGFRYTPVGTATAVAGSNPTIYTGVYTQVYYYDVNGGGESATQSASSIYSATTTVTTTYAGLSQGANGNTYVPAEDAVRTVTVTVVALGTGQTVCQMGTELVRSGV